ncbi:DUF5715 family protein [Parabacteroides pacaensis]|uniref:DUF5715 family protein n=1 Tax=Parabacteroides pacaensis TaxID=2086575 RepID=UPI000D0E82A5|nr:DUF5715 family protein [Parabacteroides pacaensis]
MKNLASIFVFLVCMAWLMFFSACKEKRGEMKTIRYVGSYNRDFNDLNEVHLLEAQRIGVKPLASREAAGHAAKKMVEIESNKVYEVEELTYSIPFLIPEAAELLESIGRNFRDSLKNLNAPEYKVLVTSVTRTEADVKKLRRRNLNASPNSAHRYGTTFDVSWKRFLKIDDKDPVNVEPEKLKMVLASVLKDLKKQNLCYVKHERKQGCFHITVRNK